MRIHTSNKLNCFNYPIYRTPSYSTMETILEMYRRIREEAYTLNKRQILLYVTGSSGMFIATHIQMLFREDIDVKIIYVNKEKEVRHTDDVQVVNINKRSCLTVFVDDFISSGHTLQLVFKRAGIVIDGICVSGNVYKDTTVDYISQKQQKGLKFIICRKYHKD